MKPIVLSADTARAVCQRFATTYPSLRKGSGVVWIERGAGRVILAAKDAESLTVFCHLLAPLPLTDFQRRISEPKWEAEAMRFMVPFDNLRTAAMSARDTLSLTPEGAHSGQLLLCRFLVLDPTNFPPVLPLLADLREGWSTVLLHTGRVDVAALAAES